MGRTPKPTNEKVGRPVRALVTQRVMDAIEDIMIRDNLTLSEVIRLGLFELMILERNDTEEFIEDPTWSTLKRKGHI